MTTRPRLVGLVLFALAALPGILFISKRVPPLVPELIIGTLMASVVLICHGFRNKPCVGGAVLVLVMNPIIGQLLLLWVVRYLKTLQHFLPALN